MPKRLQLIAGDDTIAAQVAGAEITLEPGGVIAVEATDGRLRAAVDGQTLIGNAVASGDSIWVTVEGEVFVIEVVHGAGRHRASGHAAFTPPMPATVVRIAVKPGDTVREGDVLIALEAMKMELPLRAPRDGVVLAVNCREGELVQPDQVLLDLE